MLQSLFACLVYGEIGYPLKNGDFSTYLGFGKPAGWDTIIKQGEPLFNIDTSNKNISYKNSDVSVTIEVNEGDYGCYFQNALCARISETVPCH